MEGFVLPARFGFHGHAVQMFMGSEVLESRFSEILNEQICCVVVVGRKAKP